MADFKTEIVIDRPVAQVFNFLATNFEANLPKVETNFLYVEQLTEGEVGKGTLFRAIRAKKDGEQDSSNRDFFKDLDLNTLDPELRSELEEIFLEVTAFEKDRLFEIVRVGEENKKILENYSFSPENKGTKVFYKINFDSSMVRGDLEKKNRELGNSKITNFALKLFANPILKSGVKNGLKTMKAIIEAELKPGPTNV
ncbi:MAG: hypothetical protein J0I20_27680 [Chloroflexi bacterium]|nr:hypothetical protein [Chloroflexota bacterium]OJV95858.1 MAG: hypothetical protein BGO39_21330 [Chloroflexi bacterium 54-19]